MTKKLFFILTTILFVAKSVLAADCSNIKTNIQINLTSSYGKLLLNQDKPLSEITTLAKSLNLVENGLFASGLSTVNVNFDITLNAVGTPLEEGVFCVAPTKITLFFGLDSPTIYLANELIKDSCEYNLVLRHEQTHQQINVKALEYFIPLFEQAIKKISQEIPAEPVTAMSRSALSRGSEQIAEAYSKRIEPLNKTRMVIERSNNKFGFRIITTYPLLK